MHRTGFYFLYRSINIGLLIPLQDVFESFTYHTAYNYESIAFIKKFLDFTNLKIDIKGENKKILNQSSHSLEFTGVYFSYPNSNEFTLKNINFKIRTGEVVSLAGTNGSGKTTLIYLILRIYKPQKGNILLDGIDIEEYDYESGMSFFSTIFQDYQKYAVKLYDYISFGNIQEARNNLKAKQAAKKATISNFMNKLPNGLNSNLTKLFDEQGLELSVGQWRKLVIASFFQKLVH